jgi:hypothetical protein
MSDDLIARALAAVAATTPPVDTATNSTLVARARAAVAAPSKSTTLVAEPPPPERITIKVRCKDFLQDFPLIVERRGTALVPVGESPRMMSEAEASQYTREITGPWRCPICTKRAWGYAKTLKGRLCG